jgi:hypothetical protein
MTHTTEFIDLSDHDAFVAAVPHETFAQVSRQLDRAGHDRRSRRAGDGGLRDRPARLTRQRCSSSPSPTAIALIGIGAFAIVPITSSTTAPTDAMSIVLPLILLVAGIAGMVVAAAIRALRPHRRAGSRRADGARHDVTQATRRTTVPAGSRPSR